LTVKQTTCHST